MSLATCPICSESTNAERPNRDTIVGPDGEVALLRCPSCASRVSVDDDECRTCGYDLSAHALSLPSASPDARSGRGAPNFRRLLMGGAVLMLTGGVLLGSALLLPALMRADPAEPAASRPAFVPQLTIVAPIATQAVDPTATPVPTETPLPTATVMVSSIPVIGGDAVPTPELAATVTAEPVPILATAIATAAQTAPPVALPSALPAGTTGGTVRAFQEKVVVRPTPALGAQLTFVLNGASVAVECVTQGGAVPGSTSTEWYRVRVTEGVVGYIHAPIIDVAGAAVPACQ